MGRDSGSPLRCLRDRALFQSWLRRRGPVWVVFFILVFIMIYLISNVWHAEVLDLNGNKVTFPSTKPSTSLTDPQKSDKSDDTPRASFSDPSAVDPVALNALQAVVNSYDPAAKVAFAIPVGGRTQRAAQLAEIIRTLIAGGAPAANIFVMEDVLGRPGATNDVKVGDVVRELKVRRVSSYVSRADMPETSKNFGIHLARHYKFMLDFLLVSPTEAKARGDDLLIFGEGSHSPYEFVVIIEDDLVLSKDFVKYFYAMSRVMKVDPSLYCVSAHQDNAFFGTSWEPDFSNVALKSLKNELDPLGFDFRRGNHFMAPGWMTSAEIYTEVVRPFWLDANGEYAYKDKLHLRNGHWDRFFDSLIGKRDCIFPEIPRIIHQGADGFTVDQRAQMELYSNLRLSSLPVDTSYGDLFRMTKDGYIKSEMEFISASTMLTSLEEVRMFRNSKLLYLVDAKDDKDEVWNSVLNGFFGVIGVGGYGGYEGYVKVRGIFSGAVFVRWLSNLILLVGAYSPYMGYIERHAAELKPSSTFAMTNGGCFHDKPGIERDLPYLVPYYKASLLTPRACLSSCIHLGFRYAGLQAGMECWCGNSFGRHGKVEGGSRGCEATCGDRVRSLFEKQSTMSTDPVQCGGDWTNSVYWAADEPKMHERVMAAPADAVYVVGQPGQSCTEACTSASTPLRRLSCNEALFPLLHRNCGLLQSLVGCKEGCKEEGDIMKGIVSPGGDSSAGMCTLSRGSYIKCSSKSTFVPATYKRACVCEIKGGIKNALGQQ